MAAIYAGNEEVATKFSTENEIHTFKWSIGNYEECVSGIKKVEETLGPEWKLILLQRTGIDVPEPVPVKPIGTSKGIEASSSIHSM